MFGRKVVIMVVFLMFLFPVDGFSQWSIHITLRSYHFDRETTEYNEWNLGIGGGYKIGHNFQVEIGGYHNSEGDISFYSLVTGIYPRDKPIAGGVAVGMVTGYDELPTFAFPMISVGTRVGINPYLRISYVPAGKGLIASQITYHHGKRRFIIP